MTRGTLTPEWYQRYTKKAKDDEQPSEEPNKSVGEAARKLLRGRKCER